MQGRKCEHKRIVLPRWCWNHGYALRMPCDNVMTYVKALGWGWCRASVDLGEELRCCAFMLCHQT